MPENNLLIADPNLLKSEIRSQPITVFLCGPNSTHESYQMREYIRNYIQRFSNSYAVFGEDIDIPDVRKLVSKSKIDLQTLESAYAHTVGITILLLDSPGAFAELGTFSMMTSLRPRLYVLIPSRFYGAQSYIARGPLSVLDNNCPGHSIYFRGKDDIVVEQSLNIAMMTHKYGQWAEPFRYRRLVLNATHRDAATQYLHKIDETMKCMIVLATILAIENPTYSDLVLWTHLVPDELTAALKVLFRNKSIIKDPNGIYRSVNQFDDAQLACFDTSRLSKRKAEVFAKRGRQRHAPV